MADEKHPNDEYVTPGSTTAGVPLPSPWPPVEKKDDDKPARAAKS